jgi:replicative DNA helicase
MSKLRQRIQEISKQHGSLRAAARALEIDAGYLSRLQNGEKIEPSDDMLRKLNLRRIVTYIDRNITIL